MVRALLRSCRSKAGATLFVLPLVLATHAPFGTPVAADVQADAPRLAAVPARLPVRFDPNLGQWDEEVRFVARGRGVTLVLTDDGAMLALGDAHVTMRLAGGRPAAPVGEEPLVTRVNYFLGNDPGRWRADLPTFARARAEGVLPGVDVVWRGGESGLEYDLVVRPGADILALAVDIEGANALRTRDDGSLEIDMPSGVLVQTPPRVFQGERELPSRQRVVGRHRVTFDIDGYDPSRELLVDPGVLYSTYLGGAGNDGANGVAIDAAGNAYVTGYTYSINFPTANALQPTLKGRPDAFVTKLNAAGSAEVYSTYLGGTTTDMGTAIAVDGAGNAYVTGRTDATDFPTVAPLQGAYGGAMDAFVAKLNPAGSALVYSTYLGGNQFESSDAIAADSAGNAYVGGGTASANYPTLNALQATYGGGWDGFVAKLTAAGAGAYSTFLGGSSFDEVHAIAVDGAGNAHLAGATSSTNFPTVAPLQANNAGSQDAFVAELAASGASLLYSTYLGGAGYDGASSIALDGAGAAYVAGFTASTDFPLRGPAQPAFAGQNDAFISKLSAAGSQLDFSTYLGGSGNDGANGIGVDGSGSAHVALFTGSVDFPTAGGPLAVAPNASSNAAVAVLNAPGSGLRYATFIGAGAGAAAVAVASSGAFVVTGQTSGGLFIQGGFQPTYGGGGDGFVTTFSAAPTEVSISPSAFSTPPRGAQTFNATGGSGYAFSLMLNGSGGTIDGTSGAYVAGAKGNTTDVIAVRDATQRSALATVTIGPALTVTPASGRVRPGGSVAFTVAGGSAKGFVWSLKTNQSGGAIEAATGKYTAGPKDGFDDVHVADSLGNVADVNVTIGASIVIIPDSPSVAPGGVVPFAATGGSGAGYAWSLRTNASTATIDAKTGVYTAGPTGGVTDVVAVTDVAGGSASTSVAVAPTAGGPSGGRDAGDTGAAPASDGGKGCACRTARPGPGDAALMLLVLALARVTRRPLTSRCGKSTRRAPSR